MAEAVRKTKTVEENVNVRHANKEGEAAGAAGGGHRGAGRRQEHLAARPAIQDESNLAALGLVYQKQIHSPFRIHTDSEETRA